MAVTSSAVGALCLAIGIAALISILFRPKAAEREPPLIHPKVPFIGHIIGLLQEGPLYLLRISAKSNAPIFTLPMLNSRTYVCKSPAYAALIQRSSSTLDFDQLIVELTPRMVGLNAHTKQLLQDPGAKTENRVRMVAKSHDIITPPLTPRHMSGITKIQLDHFSKFLNRIADDQEVELFKFVTRELTAASMHTFYGPENPFAVHPELIQAFWDWEGSIIAYMTGIFPRLTARKAHQGLEKCVQGFVEYAERGGYKGAYELLVNRKRLHEEAGVTPSEHARLEMAMVFAFNSNASITAFWMLNHIFSRPSLLAEIREEVSANALLNPDTITFTRLRDACPLLNSVYKETMRLAAPLSSARFVLDDTLVGDTYLLRKNTVVQIAGGIIHADAAIWGPDVDAFNPRRFYYHWNGSKTGADGAVCADRDSQVHAAAFRAFGGGTSLCPGRHFAQMEILALTAALALGWDMLPPRGAREVAWDPPRYDKRFPFAVVKPLRALDVRLRRRPSAEGVKWKLVV